MADGHSAESVAATIDGVEPELRQLWAILCGLKTGAVDPVQILDFQPRLAHALWTLDRLRVDLSRARRDLVARKRATGSDWHVRKLRASARYSKAVVEAAKVGRSLGDCFAWFFVQNDLAHLGQHLAHAKTNQIPSGLGGEGELRFVETVKRIDRFFVLYHGITNFLRVGDFSLVSMREMKIAGLGEIKTSKVSPQTIEVQTHIVGPSDWRMRGEVSAEPHARPTTSDKRPPSFERHLRRQVRTMADALAPRSPDLALWVHSDFYYEELEALLGALARVTTVYRQCGDSLLLVGHRPRGVRFSSRMLGRQQVNRDRAFPRLAEHVIAVCDPAKCVDAGDVTSIRVGHISNHVALGLAPLFWWPVAVNLLEPLFFHDAIVASIYNPAFLIGRLRAAGYNVEAIEGGRRFGVTRKLGGYDVRFEGVDWFFALTPQYLFKEEAVVSLFESIFDQVRDKNPGPNVKINLNLMQYFGDPPDVAVSQESSRTPDSS